MAFARPIGATTTTPNTLGLRTLCSQVLMPSPSLLRTSLLHQCISNIATLSLDQVGYRTILHCGQQNNDNFQSNTYGKCTSNPILCSVAAMLCIAQHALCLALLALRAVAVYSSTVTRSRQTITGTFITVFLCSVAQHVYKLPPHSLQLKLWSPHSI